MGSHKVLVTGASGFIGGRVVERLALSEPACVRALVHKWSRAARVARFPIEIVAGDITSAADAAAAMDGITHVVHCANADANDVTIGGTQTLLQAALDAGVERFVHVSTAEVYGAHVFGAVDETTAVKPTGRAYGDAKLAAEELCREFGRQGLPTTIVRPSIVYGPFGRSWTVGVAKRLLSGNWCEFEGYGDGYCNAVYVDDLVSALLLAVRHPEAAGETFNINGAELPTWNEYFRKFNTALGRPPLATKSAGRRALRSSMIDRTGRVIRMFVGRFQDRLMEIYARGGVATRVMKSVKTWLDTTPSPGELEDLYRRAAIYSDAKARERLGYRPQYDLDRGLRMSALWLAQHGFIDAPAKATNERVRRRLAAPVQVAEPISAPS